MSLFFPKSVSPISLQQLFLPLSLSLLLGGCLSSPQRTAAPVIESTPAPVGSEATQPQYQERGEVIEESGVVLSAYEPPAPIATTPIHSSAVASLLKRAVGQEQAGDYSGGVETLERALRIEPRNAHLWFRLARLRLAQKRHSQAAELAMKSKALAGGDKELKRDNWVLIAKSRRASGDEKGAREAERKARMLFY